MCLLQLPRVTLVAEMTNNVMHSTAANAVAAALYTQLVDEALQEQAYDASLAGYSYSLSGTTSFVLELSGYSDKFSEWALAVADAMVQPSVDADTFSTLQHLLVQDLQNANEEQPCVCCASVSVLQLCSCVPPAPRQIPRRHALASCACEAGQVPNVGVGCSRRGSHPRRCAANHPAAA